MRQCVRYVLSLGMSFMLLQQANAQWVDGNDVRLQYTGRVQQLQKATRWWMPGTYVRFAFKADTLKIVLRDQVQYGVQHNYIALQIDDGPPIRIRLKNSYDTLSVPVNDDKIHTALLCKNTESNIGYVDVVGVRAREIRSPSTTKKKLIEFFGDSITCGAGSDAGLVQCGAGRWEDQHNAYLAYGPLTARKSSADWVLSAVSGIGLMRSCCDMKISLPQVFDKVIMHQDSVAWNFKQYTPDIVFICLGQNDGIQDSVVFQKIYIDFLKRIRKQYPETTMVLLSSPMADAALGAFLKNQLTAISKIMKMSRDQKVLTYFFKKQYSSGCDDHPDLSEHEAIANELVDFLKMKKLVKG